MAFLCKQPLTVLSRERCYTSDGKICIHKLRRSTSTTCQPSDTFAMGSKFTATSGFLPQSLHILVCPTSTSDLSDRPPPTLVSYLSPQTKMQWYSTCSPAIRTFSTQIISRLQLASKLSRDLGFNRIRLDLYWQT